MPQGGDELLRDLEVAKLTGYSVHTLRQWRSANSANHGPPWVKNGRAVRYKESEVQAWIRSLTSAPQGATLATTGTG